MHSGIDLLNFVLEFMRFYAFVQLYSLYSFLKLLN